ncbi:MAG TPA: ABC transporter ATP-binding protein [Clostridiales bacterium]|nr:ABC transporter ATP-binding protein [Clostridiales bacterium]
MSNVVLDVRAVSKNYGSFALRDVSFSIPKGYIMGLIGPNGAGKTTLIHLILNLLRRDSGEILVFGMDNIADDSAIKQQVGVVFDSVPYVEDWKVKDVGKAMSLFYDSWSQSRYLELVEKFHLDMGKKVKELSRGMQTKLMLACALAHEARLLILDEPTSGMDPVARDELMDMLRQYIADGEKSVLFSTHITSDLERAADFITYIRNGQLFFTGPTDELLEGWRLLKGGRSELTNELREKIVGLREHHAGFDGLVKAKDFPAPPDGCVLDHASIEDIMLYTAKEAMPS